MEHRTLPRLVWGGALWGLDLRKSVGRSALEFVAWGEPPLAVLRLRTLMWCLALPLLVWGALLRAHGLHALVASFALSPLV